MIMKPNLCEISPLECAAVDSLRPLVDDFVRSQEKLSFRDDYWPAFRKWLCATKGDPNATVYVAEVAGETAGLLTAKIEENGPLLSPRKIGYIGLLVVAPRFRRKGIGDALWQKAHGWFLAQGMPEVQLYTEVGNTASRTFWERIGFSVFVERQRMRI